LTIGDSIRRSIDKGLAQSRYGLVILSKNFFQKNWTQKELDGLTAKEHGRKVILPLWHKIDREYVERFSLTLADLIAVSTDKGIDNIVEELKKVVMPSEEKQGNFSSIKERTPRKPRRVMRTSLAEFEGRAFMASIFALLILVYLSSRLVAFWTLAKGINLAGWINPELIILPISIMIIIGVLQYVFKGSLTRGVISSLRRISSLYLMSLALFTLLMVILNMMIFLYPETTRFFFQNAWQDFLLVCISSLAIESVAYILSYFLIEQYFAKIKDWQYKPHHVEETKRLFQTLKQQARTIRNRSSISVILIALVITVGIVPIDLATGLFVPSYHQEESFSHSYYSVSDKDCLFIYNERVSPTLVRSECRFYRLAQTEYTIYPAKFPLLNAIRVQNPTNVTVASIGSPYMGSTFSDYSTHDLGYVYNSTPPSVNCTFIPETYNFTYVQFGFPSVSEPFMVNISYWKFLENVSISVTDSEPRYLNLGNDSWLETYTLMITNNENIPLRVMALDFDRFMYAVVNTTTTRVYSQGQELPWAYFVYSNRRLGELTTIGSGYTLNLTITFQSSDIS
jgi:hypothetical protein